MSSKLKRGRPIQGQAREVLWNIHDFMATEAQEAKNCVFTPERFADVLDRTARAAKVPKKTVMRILHEKDQDSSPAGPSTKPKEIPKEGKSLEHLDLDDFEYQEIRKKIYDLYFVDKQQVTLNTLFNKLKVEIGFPGSRGHLRQILKELGFKFRKINTYRRLLAETDEVRLLRIKYLKQIKQYRSEGRDIVYGDEMCVYITQTNELVWSDKCRTGIRNQYYKEKRLTIVHAGSANGFVPNALLIYESAALDKRSAMNNYEKWLQEKLVPNLQPNSILVVDNATYYRTLEDKAPNSNSTRKIMRDWLSSKNIPFEPTLLKPELYEIIKQHKHQYVQYSLDTIMESYGHKVLRLPPYYPDLNPIKNIWSQVKAHVINKYNAGINLTEVQQLMTEKLASLGQEVWVKLVGEAIKSENEFLKLEDSVDVLDQLTVNSYNNLSSSSGSSHGDSDNESSDCSDADAETTQPFTAVFIKTEK